MDYTEKVTALGKYYEEVEKDEHATLCIFQFRYITKRKYSGFSNPLHKTF